jgi:hypothetical protein
VSARFVVEVRAGYRNPMRHGIRGADRYSVTLSALDKAGAASGAPLAVREHLATHYPWIEVTSARVIRAPHALERADMVPLGVVELGPM